MIKSTSAQQPQEQVLRAANDQPAIASLPVVFCQICHAGYAPAPTHEDLKHAPPVVLESVLMGMCHFCFRCRRAACPACWDEIHGVCGSCTQEAHLPFRSEVRQLEGTMLPPIRQVHEIQNKPVSPLLVFVRPARFQAELSQATGMFQRLTVPSPAAIHPPALQGEEQPEKPGNFKTERATMQKPTVEKPVAQKLEEEEEKTDRPRTSFLKIVERMVTTILTIILIAIIVLIVLAEASVPANAIIVHLLHIDIRQEVEYLLSVIHQLH